MNREDDVGKTLGKWLGKAKAIGSPPEHTEVAGNLQRPERGRGIGGSDPFTQLNFKIPHSTKKKIKQLALRDNITLLMMLDRMVALYEKEHGPLSRK